MQLLYLHPAIVMVLLDYRIFVYNNTIQINGR